MCQIVVNATAARTSGALSILNQFINHLPQETSDIYYIFVDSSYSQILRDNVNYIIVDTTSWVKRVKWDEYGCKDWMKRNKIHPVLIISLQNTGIKFDEKVPQLIYYHQPLTLFPKKWRWYKKDELLFFLYKQFYSYFVSRYIFSNTSFVVQIPSVKEMFLRKFSIEEKNVYVISPEFQTVNIDDDYFVFHDGYVHLIYPATPLTYKNHLILLYALHYLKMHERVIYSKIKLHLTLPKNNMLNIKIEALGIADAIVFEDTIPYLKLLSYYHAMDALLFPSFIESFGLPLLEAAGTGLPIIAADLPYVHDVVGKYEGVIFVDYRDKIAWAMAIKDICYNRKRYSPYEYKNKSGWSDFFILIEHLKNK